MKKFAKIWIYGILTFFILHLIRDILQDLKIHTFISDILVKGERSKAPWWYWVVFNTYLIEISEIALALFVLKRNRFGQVGYLTIMIAAAFFSAWLYFWIFL